MEIRSKVTVQRSAPPLGMGYYREYVYDGGQYPVIKLDVTGPARVVITGAGYIYAEAYGPNGNNYWGEGEDRIEFDIPDSGIYDCFIYPDDPAPGRIALLGS